MPEEGIKQVVVLRAGFLFAAKLFSDTFTTPRSTKDEGDRKLCVSAESSFGLAGLLAPVGAYCLRNAYRQDRLALPLAAVPLFFGVQQMCEGFVWVGIGRGDDRLTHGAALAYLFFALLFWLVWIPFCALMLEERRREKILLGVDLLLGLIGGVAFYLPILLHREVLVVGIGGGSIRYDVAQSPALGVVSALVWHMAYVAVVSVPFFLVSRRRKGLFAFSTALVVSASISHVYFLYTFASVWCFFAAILSLMLGYMFRRVPFLERVSGE